MQNCYGFATKALVVSLLTCLKLDFGEAYQSFRARAAEVATMKKKIGEQRKSYATQRTTMFKDMENSAQDPQH